MARGLTAQRIEEIINAKEQRHGLVAVSDYDDLVLAYKDQGERIRTLEESNKMWFNEAKKAHKEAEIKTGLLRELEVEHDAIAGEPHLIGCVNMNCLRCRIRSALGVK